MPIRGVCLNGDVGYLGGSLARLGEELATCQACGYGGIAATMPFGEADLHMPPGWGTIPLAAALAQMPGFIGLCILEIQPRWADHRAEALAAARQLFATAPDSPWM